MTHAASVVSALALVGMAGGMAVSPPSTQSVPEACPGCPAGWSPARPGVGRPTLDAGLPGTRWLWPLAPRPEVVRRFERPLSTYGPGHRGIDLLGTRGQVVRAVADGVVTHAGRIDGRGTVTVRHPSGLRSTYEPVISAVVVGQEVAAGELIGVLSSAGSHCGADTCLHLGAVRARTYLDPLALLSPTRVVLLPPRRSGDTQPGT